MTWQSVLFIVLFTANVVLAFWAGQQRGKMIAWREINAKLLAATKKAPQR